MQNINVTFTDTNSLYQFVEVYLKTLPSLADAGGSGYWYIDPLGYIQRNGKPTFIVLHFFFNKTDTNAIEAVLKPVYDSVNSINGTQSANLTIPIPLARYVLPQPDGSDPTGGNAIVGTRLYARSILESESGPATYAKALKNVTTYLPTIIEGHLTAGGQVARNAGIDSALNPSWRIALGEIIIPVSWSDNTPVELQVALTTALTDVYMPQLISVDPTIGAYTNEANAYEPEWQTVFWGTNYPRLLQVKNKWDPRGLFRCNRCVGSERWDATGNCPAQ